MTPDVRRTAALGRFIDYLGELGPRWGLPAEPCRIHAYLYVIARPATEEEIRRVIARTAPQVAEALEWLCDYRLVTKVGAAWRTSADPWELLLRGLEERRRREIGPALELLRECLGGLNRKESADRTASRQIGKLVDLVEDVAAIDTQAQRLSPQTLRRFVSIGGRVSRFLNRDHRRRDWR